MKIEEQYSVFEELSELADEIKVDVVSLYIFDQKSNSLLLFSSYGLDKKSWGTKIPLSRGLVGKCAREKKPLSVKNPMKHPDFYYVPGSGEEKYSTLIAFPVVDGNNLLGVIVIQTIEMRNYTFDDINRMLDMAYKHIPSLYSKIHSVD